MFVGAFFGRTIVRRLSAQRFALIIEAVLIFSGVVFIVG